MPSQSKAQQRFFGVVKSMQQGDTPKKGKAGKAAKSMSKDDVDDFASTKHKGLPNKVKRENRVKSLIKKIVREIMAEDFAGAYPKNKRKSFDNKRKKQAEVLGYTLTGKDDIKTEIDDATVKENIEEALPAIAMGLARGAAVARAVGSAVRAGQALKKNKGGNTDDASEEYEELKERIKKILKNNPKLKEGLMGALAAKTAGVGFKAGAKIADFKPEKDDEIEEIQEKTMKLTKSRLRNIVMEVIKEDTYTGLKKSSSPAIRGGDNYYTDPMKQAELDRYKKVTAMMGKKKKKKKTNEQNLDKVKVPAGINRFMGKFIGAVQGGKLDRNRQKAILYKVVKGLGISPREFQTYVQKVKQGL
jgi:hypothetical protein